MNVAVVTILLFSVFGVYRLDASAQAQEEESVYENVEEFEIDEPSNFTSASPSEGDYCVCLYPPSSDYQDHEEQQVVYGVWQTRRITFSGNVLERFVCNIPEFVISSHPIGVRISEEDCEHPDL
ncbi:MAG: hypothetical protein ACFE0I_21525 [Elainellaceae cyanobacterium]